MVSPNGKYCNRVRLEENGFVVDIRNNNAERGGVLLDDYGKLRCQDGCHNPSKEDCSMGYV